jgi:hypothetical protein
MSFNVSGAALFLPEARPGVSNRCFSICVRWQRGLHLPPEERSCLRHGALRAIGSGKAFHAGNSAVPLMTRNDAITFAPTHTAR